MKISYNWLKNYLNLELPANEVSVFLTDIGLEVEGVNSFETVKGGLKGIIIGEVLTKNQHPNADRLSITTVDIGADMPLQIICGAQNVNIGLKVLVATVGTTLYNGHDSFKIKKSKIRGEDSFGMICSEYELGLGKCNDGIMELNTKAIVGDNSSDYFQLEIDTVFDIGLTPNRSDAMGHIGVARDLMTVLNHKGSKLQMCKPSIDDFIVSDTSKTISVELSDNVLCPRYSGVSISGIKVADSPKWIQNKLNAIGVQPINNVVDITNYVLHETGQPLHAFDIAKINDKKIIISTVKEKTKFTILDGTEIELSSDDLMINNSHKPMCIAGVYGGIDYGVTKQTTDIFLESAYFNPISIRKTAKRHNLSTDASFRYERGCDPDITIYSLKRAALLITEICNGYVSSEVFDAYPNKIKHFEVYLNYSKMDSLIGEFIDRDVVKAILLDLEIEIMNDYKDGLSLIVPLFRTDVCREVDIIEEVLRIYGYNTVKIPSKLNSSMLFQDGVNSENIRNTISDLLTNNGFNEVMNNSLTSDKYSGLISEIDINQNIKILNPLSQDLNVMRQSLLFNCLENIKYNQNRKNTDIKFYEFGKTYHKKLKENTENQHLQILLSGRIEKENWNTNDDKSNFFFLKNKVEHILNRLGVKKIKSELLNSYGFFEGLLYTVDNKRLVCFGKLNDDLCKKFGIKAEVYSADFNWDLLLEMASKNRIKYNDVSKFPSIRRDLSLLIKKSVSFDELKEIAVEANIKTLKSFNLFDVYEGDSIPSNMKSYSLSFVMSDIKKTLTDKHVDKVMEKLIKLFTETTGAKIR